MMHSLRKYLRLCFRLLKPHGLFIVCLGLFPAGSYLLSRLDATDRQGLTPLFLLLLVALGFALLGEIAHQSLLHPGPRKRWQSLLELLFLTGAGIILSIAGYRLTVLAFQTFFQTIS